MPLITKRVAASVKCCRWSDPVFKLITAPYHLFHYADAIRKITQLKSVFEFF